MSKPKHPGGRPTDYRPEYCEQLINHMEAGGSIKSLSAKLGVSFDAMYKWFDKYPEFNEAKKVGESLSYAWFEEQSHRGMWIPTAHGEVLNTTLWYMNMKNRFGWRDKHEVEQSGTVTQVHDASELKTLLDIAVDLKKSRKK